VTTSDWNFCIFQPYDLKSSSLGEEAPGPARGRSDNSALALVTACSRAPGPCFWCAFSRFKGARFCCVWGALWPCYSRRERVVSLANRCEWIEGLWAWWCWVLRVLPLAVGDGIWQGADPCSLDPGACTRGARINKRRDVFFCWPESLGGNPTHGSSLCGEGPTADPFHPSPAACCSHLQLQQLLL